MKPERETPKPLPCPLCMGQVTVVNDRTNPTFGNVCRCQECGLETFYHDDSYAGAINMWNASIERGILYAFINKKAEEG